MTAIVDPTTVYDLVRDTREDVFNALQMLDAGDPDEARRFVIKALGHANLALGEFDDPEDDADA